MVKEGQKKEQEEREGGKEWRKEGGKKERKRWGLEKEGGRH